MLHTQNNILLVCLPLKPHSGQHRMHFLLSKNTKTLRRLFIFLQQEQQYTAKLLLIKHPGFCYTTTARKEETVEVYLFVIAGQSLVVGLRCLLQSLVFCRLPHGGAPAPDGYLPGATSPQSSDRHGSSQRANPLTQSAHCEVSAAIKEAVFCMSLAARLCTSSDSRAPTLSSPGLPPLSSSAFTENGVPHVQTVTTGLCPLTDRSGKTQERLLIKVFSMHPSDKLHTVVLNADQPSSTFSLCDVQAGILPLLITRRRICCFPESAFSSGIIQGVKPLSPPPRRGCCR